MKIVFPTLICESLFIKHNINEAHATFQLQNQDNSEIHASWKISYPEMNLNFVIVNKIDWNTERGSGIFLQPLCVLHFSMVFKAWKNYASQNFIFHFNDIVTYDIILTSQGYGEVGWSFFPRSFTLGFNLKVASHNETSEVQ